jgi:hypothetical protein
VSYRVILRTALLLLKLDISSSRGWSNSVGAAKRTIDTSGEPYGKWVLCFAVKCILITIYPWAITSSIASIETPRLLFLYRIGEIVKMWRLPRSYLVRTSTSTTVYHIITDPNVLTCANYCHLYIKDHI